MEQAQDPRKAEPLLDPDHPEFEQFEWKGQLRYRCNLKWESGAPCLFDTYDLGQMVQHLKGPHNRSGKVAKAAGARVSPILGPDGGRVVMTPPDVPPEFSGKLKDE